MNVHLLVALLRMCQRAAVQGTGRRPEAGGLELRMWVMVAQAPQRPTWQGNSIPSLPHPYIPQPRLTFTRRAYSYRSNRQYLVCISPSKSLSAAHFTSHFAARPLAPCVKIPGVGAPALATSCRMVLLDAKTPTPTPFLPPTIQREVDILRRQLREAGQQLEGYILVSRKRGVGAGVGADDGFGDSSREDDLALGADWDT